MGKLDGKTALIAYAGGGIGKAIAEAFVAEGAKVIVQDDDAAKLAGVPGEQVIADLRKKEDADKLIAKAGGKLNILVNNEDHVIGGKLGKLTTEDFITTVDYNLKTIWHTLAAVYAGMKEAGGNISIINIGSVAGAAGIDKYADYSAVKACLFGLTKTVAREWSRFKNVRCNTIMTGQIKFSEGYTEQGIGKKAAKALSMNNPLASTVVKPQDIAKIAVFLASDDSIAINAEMINAAGGLYTISGE
ncbi:MAG: SDR family oxidoreductase [Candidatus Lokiarchaeota archaeon]|nr:SDR family oxidoreductase [Candidatus Lokiarchaeota archaeon]